MQKRTPVLATINIGGLNDGNIPGSRANEERGAAVGTERPRDSASTLRLTVAVSLHRILPFSDRNLLDNRSGESILQKR